LTNIARDVVDDARVGRVYVPAALLRQHGIQTIDPDDMRQRPALHAAALELLDLAELYYQSAYEGMAALPARSAWAIAAARRVYRAIGSKLRSGGPNAWDQRVSTGKGQKLALLGVSLSDVAWTRLDKRQTPRQGLWQRP
jgi:phytoene synthase